jgi:hypothetical protein
LFTIRRLGRVAFRVRQGGGEPVDVVAVEQQGRVYFLQCLIAGNVPPAERSALIERAREAGAIPLIARPGERGIEYGVPAPSRSYQPAPSSNDRQACENVRELGIFHATC